MRKLVFILSILITVEATAQTRFYIYNTITAPISPTVQAAWNVTTGNVYRMMYANSNKTKFPITAAVVVHTSGASGAAAPRKMLSATYISLPLIAQTVNSGSTISSQIRCQKNGSAQTEPMIIYFRLCNEDGTNVREIGNATSTDMINGTPANRTVTLTLGSNLTINDNDRIIVEYGGSYTVGAVSTITCAITSISSYLLSDLPVDNTNTTSLNPWVEFSQTLNFRQTGITDNEKIINNIDLNFFAYGL